MFQVCDDKDSSLIGTKYTPKSPPELKSKYLIFLEAFQNEEAKREVSNELLFVVTLQSVASR